MAEQTMAAAVIEAPGKTGVREVPVPMPGDGQVRIRVEGCGVCGSSLPLWEGRPWFNYPIDPGNPGHEAWGVIDRVGEGVAEELVGQRVAALSYRGYAQYDVADADAVVPLPAAFEGRPFPGEALGCAMNIFHRAQIRSGQSVAIVGTGFLGALLVQLAASAGARPIAISRRDYALKIAADAGARLTLPLHDYHQVIQQVREFTGTDGCDVVIEAVGEQQPLDLAGEITNTRGRLVIAGYHQEHRNVNMQLWNWRGIDVINAHERSPAAYIQGIRAAVDAVSSEKLDPWSLFTHSFALKDLGEALQTLRDKPDGMLKTWVTP